MAETTEKWTEFPARMFDRATVVCPSCLQRFKQAEDHCERCGFDAYKTVKSFPFKPPVMERFMDHAGVLDERLVYDLNDAADKFSVRFPQVGLYFCTIEMDDPVSLSEFGFWMMNACQLQEGQKEEDRAWSILLLIDVRRGILSLTPGYAIEAFIEDSSWENALQLISPDLATGDYRAALSKYVKHAEALLRDSAERVKKKVRSQ
ncbi:MAG: TPM domain-containing protein [Verrucomicrobiae bacterium]|nr:TPM domain-containing protein [Verrucomicrobiae bacterium]NNJ85685.1 TPM domain-containing protein [Akkermansiaceae bacterium]